MQLFGGSSNQDLARKIAKLMGTQLGEVELTTFANEETRVWVKEKKVEKSVVVVQSLSTPTNEHLVEFCLLCDALHRKGAREITAIIPWMGYGKQDKVFREGEPLSAKVVATILQTAKLEKIITFDLHNRATLGFFDTQIVELSAKPLLLEYFRKSITNNWLVVAPDAGAVKASSSIAQELGLDIVYMDKKRDLVSGNVAVVGMSGSVEGKTVLMIDDNVFTGSTLIESAKVLKEEGAKSVRVGLTHHLYVPGVQEKLEESEIDEVIVSDTVAQIQNSKSQITSKSKIRNKKLKVLSVAQLVVDELS